ncbi:MAG TPA: hypothetical protein VG308_09145 [Stellaceae bacterium]|jgi:hypothetical protein|nr:hypothetical protein [Stellaceae bacterium]
MKKQRLSAEQAFAAMALFLERYHARGGEDDLAGLLGDIQINERDGLPLDPAAWTDWLSALGDVLERQHLPAAEEER